MHHFNHVFDTVAARCCTSSLVSLSPVNLTTMKNKQQRSCTGNRVIEWGSCMQQKIQHEQKASARKHIQLTQSLCISCSSALALLGDRCGSKQRHKAAGGSSAQGTGLFLILTLLPHGHANMPGLLSSVCVFSSYSSEGTGVCVCAVCGCVMGKK